jgi:hypothetical protein
MQFELHRILRPENFYSLGIASDEVRGERRERHSSACHRPGNKIESQGSKKKCDTLILMYVLPHKSSVQPIDKKL